MKIALSLLLLLLLFIPAKPQKGITAGCSAPTSSAFLEVNNVRTLIHNGGDMWWDLQGSPRYEIPKGSGKHCSFAGALWIGGIDESEQLKFSGVRYRSNGCDFFAGHLKSTTENLGNTDVENCAKYDKQYVTYKKDILTFRNWFNSSIAERESNFPEYSIPDIITNWPAHGNIAEGYDYYLAPFFDNNEDGTYNPADGDYPYYDLINELPCGYSPETENSCLRGDQNIWFVFNDNGNTHSEFDGEALQIEIRAQAYAFRTMDEINNCTFYSYQIINRSVNTYHDFYVGFWSDADMGYAYDDYLESDVSRGLGILFNGLPVDEGVIYGYGGPDPPPPAFGVDVMAGLYIPDNGIDDVVACNNGINGLNFGDGIVDNERYGLTSFIYFNGTGEGSPSTQDPTTALETYNYLRCVWKDNTHMMYGGTGHPSGGSTDIPTDFMFPGTSDPCGFGQGGVPMPPWDEYSCDNSPYDRRFVISNGPGVLEPGAIATVHFGAIWDRALSGTPYSSVEELRRADDIAQSYFNNCFRLIDGPDAPELKLIQTTSELIVLLFNRPESNNYLESFHKQEPTIKCLTSQEFCDTYYSFQGYQVFQVVDTNVTVADLQNPEKAICVFQSDIKDGIGDLVNHRYNPASDNYDPYLAVDAENDGLKRSFSMKTDAFTGEPIDTGKNYCFMAVAYAHNEFSKYNPADLTSVRGQKMPYKPSTRSYGMTKVKVWQSNPDAAEFPAEPSVMFWPNPARDKVYFNTNEIDNYTIDIYRLSGEKVFSGKANGRENVLDVSGYINGIYLIKIKYIGFEKTYKLVKIR